MKEWVKNFIKVMSGRVDRYPKKEFEFTPEEMVHIERMRKIPKSIKLEIYDLPLLPDKKDTPDYIN